MMLVLLRAGAALVIVLITCSGIRKTVSLVLRRVMFTGRNLLLDLR